MIKYESISFDKIKKQAFDPLQSDGKVLLLQDLLKRYKELKQIDNLRDEDFEFVKNANSGEIKMIVN